MLAKALSTRGAVLASGICLGVGTFVIFKDLIGGDKYKLKENLTGKTAIITGANTGIGLEVARGLAHNGAAIIMACRDMDACMKAREDVILDTKNKHVKCLQLDLSSLKSIREFVAKVNEASPKINILVNNAGIMKCPRKLTEDGFEMHLGVNYLGHFLLTNLLLDKLKSSTPARIVNVTSIVQKRGKINFSDLNSDKQYDPDAAYYQSKLALMLFTEELSRRVKDSNLSVYAADPGIVKTRITRYMDVDESYTAMVIVKPLMALFAKTPRQGARTVLFCATAPNIENDSGSFYRNCELKNHEISEEQRALAGQLWKVSEKWTRLMS